ncbi:ABC transporter substrate-binding protein [Nesterenkonia salmonea]|uniref:ABC transporter substrate-binding protein n=1 Tax=Nesterenkonia salmonea TaxID=1804987 RepID=A0A5R9B804_9MICC|nr:ABC transporter substrate-binding protein [Nesterenkonia salmonea]TLP93838.1 ABC transporter substrate-binding protein [Nesterenkonia salmonea]
MKHSRLSLTASFAAIALTLTACGGDNGDDDVVSIDFYYPIAVGGPLESAMDGYIEQFNEEHEEYEVTPVYSGDYEQTLASVQSAAQAGNAPAATVLLSTDLRTLNEQDIITPIGEIVDDEDWFNSFDEPFMANSVLEDGTVGAIPFQRSTLVLYWNKELFEAAGLDPETPPETWDEMKDYGHQVMDSGADWGVMIPSSGTAIWQFEAVAIQMGLQLDSEDGTETYLDDPRAVEALENWVSLQDEGLEPQGIVDWGTVPDEFTSGTVGMVWTTTGQLTNISNSADFDFGVAPLPALEQPGSPTGGGNLYVTSGLPEEEQEAAVELIRFLSSPEIQADWTVESGYIAPLQEAWETEPLASYVEDFPEAAVARDQLPDAEREFSTYHRQEVGQFASSAVQSALTGEGEPQELLERAQQQADDALDEYR